MGQPPDNSIVLDIAHVISETGEQINSDTHRTETQYVPGTVTIYPHDEDMAHLVASECQCPSCQMPLKLRLFQFRMIWLSSQDLARHRDLVWRTFGIGAAYWVYYLGPVIVSVLSVLVLGWLGFWPPKMISDLGPGVSDGFKYFFLLCSIIALWFLFAIHGRKLWVSDRNLTRRRFQHILESQSGMLIRESFARKRGFAMSGDFEVIAMVVRVDLMGRDTSHRLILGEGGKTYHSGWNTDTQRTVTGMNLGNSAQVSRSFPDDVVVFGMASLW